jgi:hypothetical protein
MLENGNPCTTFSAETRLLREHIVVSEDCKALNELERLRSEQVKKIKEDCVGFADAYCTERVIIHNDDDGRTPFSLSHDRVDWTTEELLPKERGVFSTNEEGWVLIRLKTVGQEPVVHRIDHRSCYSITWNPSRRVWDVFRKRK